MFWAANQHGLGRGIQRFVKPTSTLTRILPLILTLPELVLLEPYYALCRGPTTAARSVLLPWACSPYAAVLPALAQRRFLPAAVASMTILSDILPLLTANVPYSRSVTWMSHLVCTWMSVGVLLLMVLTTVAVVCFLIQRPRLCVPAEVVHSMPIVAAASLIGDFDLPGPLRGLSGLSDTERWKRLQAESVTFRVDTRIHWDGASSARLTQVLVVDKPGG